MKKKFFVNIVLLSLVGAMLICPMFCMAQEDSHLLDDIQRTQTDVAKLEQQKLFSEFLTEHCIRNCEQFISVRPYTFNFRYICTEDRYTCSERCRRCTPFFFHSECSKACKWPSLCKKRIKRLVNISSTLFDCNKTCVEKYLIN